MGCLCTQILSYGSCCPVTGQPGHLDFNTKPLFFQARSPSFRHLRSTARFWRLNLWGCSHFSTVSFRGGTGALPACFGWNSSASLPESAKASRPMRNRQRGHFLDSHSRTSVALPQQQSKHFSRMAFPLVIRSSKLNSRKMHPQQRQRNPAASAWNGFLWIYHR